MAEYKFNETVSNIAKATREANEAVTHSAVAASERNVAFAQQTLDLFNGAFAVENGL